MKNLTLSIESLESMMSRDSFLTFKNTIEFITTLFSSQERIREREREARRMIREAEK